MDLVKETEVKFYLKTAEDSYKAENYQAALKAYKKLAGLYVSMKKNSDAAAAYRRVAECYHKAKPPLKEDERKNIKEAASSYSQAAEKYSEVEEHLQAGDCYENAAKLSEEIGEPEKAVEYSLKSLLAYSKSGDSLSVSHAYTYTARYYEKLGKFDLAAESYEKAGEINLQIADNRRSAINYVAAAECYKKVGKFDKAINALANSASSNLNMRDYSKIAETYDQMADLYLKVSDFKNSVYYHKKAAELSFDNKDYSGVGMNYFKMGALYEEAKDYVNALKYYLESAEASLKAKNYDQASFSYEKVGDCYSKISDMLKASEYYVYSAKTIISGGKKDEAIKTYTKAASNFIEHAESKLIEKDYANAALFYSKAVDCYIGLDDYEGVGEIYTKMAEAYLKGGETQKSKESYILAAESYLKAGNGKSAGYAYRMAGEYEKSASCYMNYADKRAWKNEDFEAGEGFKLAARAYSKIGADAERRDKYTKALFHYEKVVKDKKSDVRSKADAFERMGECYVDISDFRRAETYFQQAFDLYTETKYEIGLNLSNAFLNQVRGENFLDLGEHAKASDMLKESFRLFEMLITSGRFDNDFTNYLSEQKELVEHLTYKIEVKPDIELIADKHAYAFSDTVLIVNGMLNNNGQYSIHTISFLSHLPEGFEVVRLPKEINELKPKESLRVSAEILVKKSGEYVVKPFEIFYKDEKDNKYVKSSNEAMISVDERPPEDFKNFRLAVEVYSRYAKAQFFNKNYFHAGDGFKKTAEIYGKFNADEKLKEYYSSAVDAFMEYTKSQPQNLADMVLISRLGDAFWNAAECYDALGDLENALENYKQAVSYYEKSKTQDKLDIGNALIAEVEAKKAIEQGEYSTASELLSNSTSFFNQALKKGGLNSTQLSLIEKHNAEAILLTEKIKGTPVMSLTIECPKKVSVNQRFSLKVLLANPGDTALRKIRFMLRFPESFVVEKAPTQLIDLVQKDSQSFLIDLMAKKSGEYKFRPLDISYTDDRNNSYLRGSNQIDLSVLEGLVQAEVKAEVPGGSEDKPLVNVIIAKPPVAAKDVKLVLEGVIENESSMTLSSIRFLVNVQQDFEVIDTPELMQELAGNAKKNISIGLMPRKEGEYTLTPLEIFYKDAHGNRYFKSSNQVKVQVVSR